MRFIVLSFDGWLYGISRLCILIYCTIFGLIIINKSKKSNAVLLQYAGLTILFAGFTFLGTVIDFITILLTKNNHENVKFLIIITFMWIPLLIITSIYIGSELMIPEKKKYVILIFIVLGIIFEIILFLDPLSSTALDYPPSKGETTIVGRFIPGSPLFILMIIFFSSLFIFCGFGLLYKSFQSEGIIKKKFLFLSLAVFIITGVFFVNSFIFGILRIIISILGSFIGYWLFYISLREEPEEPKEKVPKKQIKVEESLFRIAQRPNQLTEEEVSISKEKKICLVCKGKLAKLLYMCPYCNSFYCLKCSEALSNAENACWVCNAPFDDSKPSKPFNLEEKEDIIIEDKFQT